MTNGVSRAVSRFISGFRRKGNERDIRRLLSPQVIGPNVQKHIQDHEILVRRYTGWLYICVSTLARAAGKATLRVYTTVPTRENRNIEAYGPITLKRRDTQTLLDRLDSPTRRDVSTKMRQNGREVLELSRHPFLSVWDDPNPILSGRNLIESFAVYLSLTGNHYTYVVTNGLGAPTQLWPLPANKIKIVSKKDNPVAGFAVTSGASAFEGLWSAIDDSHGEKVYSPKDIMHVRRFSPTSPYSYGLGAAKASEWMIDLLNLMDAYTEALIENDGTPSTIIAPKQSRGRGWYEKAIEEWKVLRGLAGPGVPAFLPYDAEVHQIGLDPGRIASIEDKRDARYAIARAIGIPIAFVAPNQINRATYDAAIYEMMSLTVMPLLSEVAGELNQYVAPFYARQKGNLFFAFDNLVPEDEQAKADVNAKYVERAIKTINEVRDEMLLPPVPWGKEAWVQVQMVPVSIAQSGGAFRPQLGEQKTAKRISALPAKQGGFEEEYEPEDEMIEDLKDYYTVQEKTALVAAGLMVAGREIPEEAAAFGPAWDKRLDETLWPHSRHALDRGMRFASSDLADVGVEMAFNIRSPGAAAFARRWRADLSANIWPDINRTRERAVSRAVADGLLAGERAEQVADRIAAVFDEARTTDAMRVARTETIRALNAGRQQAALQSGVFTHKVWQTVFGACSEICEGLEGETVEIDDSYSIGVSYPPAHPNCRCSQGFLVEGESGGE